MNDEACMMQCLTLAQPPGVVIDANRVHKAAREHFKFLRGYEYVPGVDKSEAQTQPPRRGRPPKETADNLTN
ncbi:MAG: hypothetical protein AAFR28_06335 [Pseudomonadota bacterium]